MTGEPQFCLRWDNYGSTLTSSLNNLYQQKEFIDVTLVAENTQFKAHKVILSACSPYFQNILKNNPCQHPVIILKEVMSDDLQSIISFIYEGKVNVTQQRLQSFMKLAKILHVRGLTESSNPISTQDGRKNDEDKEKRCSVTLDLRINRKSLPPQDTLSTISTIRCSSPTKSYDAAEIGRVSPSKHLPAASEPCRKRTRSVSPELVIPLAMSPSQSPEGGEKRGRPELHTILELKTEQPEEDPDEGKENGTGGNNMYSLRKIKSRSCSKTIATPASISRNDGATLEKRQSASTDETSNNSMSQPILTVPQRSSPASTNSSKKNKIKLQPEILKDPSSQSLPYPCPFCEKSYTSWGFRRRHIKGYHTGTPELPCKWCFTLLPTHVAWGDHVTDCHELSSNDARNGILILEEAHMVLQIAQPLRTMSLIDVGKDNKDTTSKDGRGTETSK